MATSASWNPGSETSRGGWRTFAPFGIRPIGVALAIALILALVLAMVPGRARAAGLVGPNYYYLGLGDSLAFGYQPDLDWSHGYVDQWYTNLKNHGSKSNVNLSCPGETSTSFINGGCPTGLSHTLYFGPQLHATVSFIKAHPGQVSPVSLDIGANDILPDINTSTCAISSTWQTDVAKVDANLTNTILPQLVAALTVNGARTGDLVMMNYYDPHQNDCPNTVPYLQSFNQHLASDAARFGVPIADVFTAFGGPNVPNWNIYNDTWMPLDIHATTTGYGVIAGAFEQVTGY
jgi:lysophospholipase L1-like esterase